MVHNSWAGQGLLESRAQGVTSKCSHLILPVSLLIIACFLAILQPVSAASTTCYDPSGNIRKEDRPCYPNAVDSFCCDLGWVCTNASFCIAGPDIVLNTGDPEQFEGSCTDVTWNSESCPSFCRNGNLSTNSVNGLWDCSGGDWCCSVYTGDTTCCERDAGVFFLGDFVNVTTIGGSIGPGFSTSTSSSTTSTSPTAPPTTPASITSSTSAASSPAVSSPAPTSEISSSGLDGGAKAGIAVGAVVGAILVVALVYLIWRNRRLVKSSRESVQMLSGYGNDPQKYTQFEMTGNIAPYHAQQRYEHGGIGAERAELPVEDPRMR